MGIQIYVLFYLERHESVNIAGQEDQAVVRAKRRAIGEFVDIASALEAEGLKYLEGSVHRQAVDVHFARLLDDVVGIVDLVDGNSDAVRRVGKLVFSNELST